MPFAVQINNRLEHATSLLGYVIITFILKYKTD